jgi:hypothetical protein
MSRIVPNDEQLLALKHADRLYRKSSSVYFNDAQLNREAALAAWDAIEYLLEETSFVKIVLNGDE